MPQIESLKVDLAAHSFQHNYADEAMLPTEADIRNMTRKQLLRFAEAKMVWQNLVAEKPMIGFVPNYKSEMVLKSDARNTIYLGGNGTMKTASAVNVLGNFMFGIQNRWFDLPRFRRMPKPVRARLIGTRANLSGAITEELEKWLPIKNMYRSKQMKPYYCDYRVPETEATLECMTYEQDVREFEGATLNLILFDEPPPMPIWNANVSRLRRGGYIYMFMTPLTQAGWILDMLRSGNVPISHKEIFKEDNPPPIPVPEHKGSGIYYAREWKAVVCSQDENSVEKGIRGILTMEQIKAMERDTDKSERLARRKGHFLHLSGLIFKDFRAEVPEGAEGNDVWCHIFDHDKYFPKERRFVRWENWMVSIGTDTHPVKPFYTLILRTDEKDNWYAYDEIIVSGVDETVEAVKAKYEELGRTEEEWMIEPQAAQVGAVSKESLLSAFRDKNVWVRQWAKGQAPRIDAIREALRYDPARNRPRLLISDRCRRLIWELQRWCYDEKTGKPAKKDNDMIDALGGIICSNPTYVMPIGVSTRPQHGEKRGYNW